MKKKLMTLITTAGLIFAVQGYAEEIKDESPSVENLVCGDENHEEESTNSIIANDDTEESKDNVIANDDETEESKDDSVIANDDTEESKDDSVIANDDTEESKDDSVIANDDTEESKDSVLAQCSNGKCPKEMINRLRREKQIERGETPDDTFTEVQGEENPAPIV